MAKSLFEQYRPNQWAQVVGQDDALKTIGVWRRRSLTGRAIMVSGNSGSGKTTIARLLAHEVADETAIREIDGRDLTEATAKGAIRELRPLGMFGDKKGRVLIVNETHRMRQDVVGQFLTLLEDNLPDHVLVIFTTTSDGLEKFEEGFDAKPFLSRCNELRLSRRGICDPFARRAAEIAVAEQLAPDGATVEDVMPRCVKLAKDNGNNLRKMLSHIEDGCLLA